jgi:ribosomal protein S18 acetylase RimI-like enzyme
VPDPTHERAGWCDRVHAAYPGILGLGASGAAPRATARFGPLTCVDLGVPHSWGLQAAYDDLPGADDLRSAVAWLDARSAGRGWEIGARETHVARHDWAGLVPVSGKPVYALPPGSARSMARGLPRGLTLTSHPTRDQIVAGYGGWMDDRGEAELLVRADDLAQPRRRFVCGLVDGEVVGSALVWWNGGTAYLSGIGVMARLRGRGYGWALTAEAARIAVDEAPDAGAEVVWMHATDEGAALYSRMGFERIDVHVSLGRGAG